MIKLVQQGLFIFIFMSCSIFSTHAQRSVDAPESYQRNLLALKFSPLPLLDYTPALQFGAELRIRKQQTFQVEYGYINSRIHPSRSRDFTGFKLKGEYRFYDARPAKVERNRFLGIQYMHKQVLVEGTEFFWRANRTYQELLPVKLTNFTNSAYVTIGQLVPLFGTVQIEIATGLGIRRLDIVYLDFPEDAERVLDFENDGFLFSPRRNGEGTAYYPALFFSLKIVVPILR